MSRDYNVTTIIASVEFDCDGPVTYLYRFDCPVSVLREGEHAPARYIGGLVRIADPSEWFQVNAPYSDRIDRTAWSHHSGLDFQSVKGNLFA